MCVGRVGYEAGFVAEVGRLCYQCTRRGQAEEWLLFLFFCFVFLSGAWILNDRGGLLLKKAIGEHYLR